MNKKFFKDSSFIIFATIALLYAIGNFIWWKLNTPIIPTGISALHFNDIFKNDVLYYNAPLIVWIMKGMFFIFGKQYFDLQIIGVNYVFFLVAIYFIYKLGLELKDKETGKVAMVLFALTPAVYYMGRHYGHQDWHVMVAMIVNIYCLIKLDDFKNSKWSILYGMTVGLGLLIKDEFLPYFFAPWLYVVVRSLVNTVETRKVLNILVTIVIGALISGCHYFRYEIINKVLHEPIIETAPIFSLTSLSVTTVDLSKYLLYPLLFFVFAVGFVLFLYKNKNRDKNIYILWFAVPWTIITFMPHVKAPEYCLGFIPCMILICSFFITSIKNIKKILVLSLIVVIYLAQYVFLIYVNDISSFNKNVYGIRSISEKSYCQGRYKMNFCFKLSQYVDNYSVTKKVLFDDTYMQKSTGIDRFFFEAMNNIYFSRTNVYDYKTRGNYDCDILFTTKNGIFTRDNQEIALKEYKRYINSPLQTEESKRIYINKRMEEIEQLKNFIKNNFILIDNIPYKDDVIEVYRLVK
ncbi:MAG: glycosyltransferase family 39 protein [Elusimicrobia bacterium]|nr:glycosyltransferase family 39 protein [Elusimicrobiota bacterium]